MIKIAIANKRKFDEGELVSTVVELPVTEDKFEEVLKEIGVEGGIHSDGWFTHKVHSLIDLRHHGAKEDFHSLNLAMELTEKLDHMQALFDGNMLDSDVADAARELEKWSIIEDAEDYIGEWIPTEDIDEMVREEAEKSWQDVKELLEEIDGTNDDYYIMTGTGTLRDLTWEEIEETAYQLIDALFRYCEANAYPNFKR